MSDVLSERQKMLEAYEEKQYPQQALLDPWGFERFLGERNLRPPYNALETWDKIGVFHPVHRVRFDLLPEVTQQLVDDNGGQLEAKLECPSADNYRIWSSLKFKYTRGLLFPNPSGVSYHPYQLFRLREVRDACRQSISFVDFTCKPADVKFWRGHVQTEMETALVHLRETEICYLREMTLLLLIEDRYLPKVTGWLRDIGGHRLNGYHTWSETFNASEVLKRSGFDIDEVKEIRKEYVRDGSIVDPNWKWYVLMRHIKDERRKELTGKARLAWDYYNVAEMLGLFLEEVTGEKQPQLDDLLFPKTNWKQQLFGLAAEDFDYGAGNALPNILRYYELDPRIKVLAIFEGQSELAFVEVWLAKHEVYFSNEDTTQYLREYGTMIIALRGNSGLSSSNIKDLARLARVQDACVFAVVDADLKEDLYTKQLNEWKSEGLIGDVFEPERLNNLQSLPIGGMLWKPCFEEANFSREEIVSAWLKVVARDKRTISFDLDKLNNAITRQRVEKPDQTWIACIDKAKTEQRLPFSKVEIARELAEAHWEADKPIVRFLKNIFVVADRARSMRYDPNVTL